MKTPLFLPMALGLLLSACDGKGSADTPHGPLPTGTTTPSGTAVIAEPRQGPCVDFAYDQSPSAVESTLTAVAERLTAAPDCLLQENRHHPACQEVTLRFAPASPWCQSRGRRVLVMDSGMTFGALTRYRQRVLAIYRIDQETGLYAPHTPTESLARGLVEAVGDTLGDSPTFIAAKQLNGVARNLRKYRLPSAHGDPQLSNLANLTPYAQFVLADFGDASLSKFCSKRVDAAFFDDMATSVIDIIRRHEISYINMASGTNLSTLERSWDRSCDGRSQSPQTQSYLRGIQQAKIAAMRRITAETDVVIAQSALYAPYEIEPTDVSFAGDCEIIRNRLRISYVARASMGFAEGGTPLGDDTSFLFDRGDARACTDFYVGLDWEDNFGPVGDAPLDLTYLGIGAGPQMTMDTSQSSALGLSYLIFRRQSVRDYPSILQDTVYSSGSAYLFNPMSYAQFELCQLPGDLCAL